jgi:hypothetical protein
MKKSIYPKKTKYGLREMITLEEKEKIASFFRVYFSWRRLIFLLIKC